MSESARMNRGIGIEFALKAQIVQPRVARSDGSHARHPGFQVGQDGGSLKGNNKIPAGQNYGSLTGNENNLPLSQGSPSPGSRRPTLG